MSDEIYLNGALECRHGQWFALPYSGPAFCAINEYGPFPTKQAALAHLGLLVKARQL